MSAKRLSGVTAIVIAAASMSLPACDQRSPGTNSTVRSSSAITDTTAQPSSMAGAPEDRTPSPMAGSSSGQQGTSQTAGVADKTAGAIDDAALTAQVKSALQSEPALRSQPINVDSENATVTLTGAVDSAAAKARANEVAASVNGVVAVVDHLTIKAS